MMQVAKRLQSLGRRSSATGENVAEAGARSVTSSAGAGPESRLRFTGVVAGLVLLLLTAGRIPTLHAQVNQGTVVINLAFVNTQGQPAVPASGNAAGVQFVFTPLTAGISPATLTTAAQSQTGTGQAVGSLQTGTYTMQEVTPSGANFLSATLSQNNGQTLALSNPATVTISPGATYTIAVVNQITSQATGTATVLISKSLATPSGQTTTGSLAGYSFTLTGQGGSNLPAQTQVTNQLGQATFSSLPAGVYSLSETPITGTTLSSVTINGLNVPQGSTFVIQAGGTYDVNVVNTVSASASGNVTIQTQLVDQNGNPLSTGVLSGYSFTIAPESGTVGTPVTVTTSSTGQAATNLAPGSYIITETAPAGSTLVSFTINNVPTTTGVFTVGVGAATNIVVTNRVASTASGTGTTAGTRTISLQTGCNNVVNTYPDGSSGQMIAANLVPATSIDSIWRFDNAAQTFRAAYFAPTAGSLQAPVDIQTLNRLDAIFVCVTTPATLAEPGA
jgi:hypothetical protein